MAQGLRPTPEVGRAVIGRASVAAEIVARHCEGTRSLAAAPFDQTRRDDRARIPEDERTPVATMSDAVMAS